MKTTHTCDGCSVTYTDWGMSLDISGGYAQFTDCFGEDARDAHTLYLCHDCVLRLVNLFPALRAKFGAGCHPTTADAPCCEFGWC